jgi:hypothetical protein
MSAMKDHYEDRRTAWVAEVTNGRTDLGFYEWHAGKMRERMFTVRWEVCVGDVASVLEAAKKGRSMASRAGNHPGPAQMTFFTVFDDHTGEAWEVDLRDESVVPRETDDDEQRECQNCHENVGYLSSRDWCDGCEETAINP